MDGWTFSRGAAVEGQASEGEISLLLDLALSPTHSDYRNRAGRVSWQMALPVVSWRPVWETMFVYWFSVMCCSYFHLPEVPRCYGDRLIGNDSFVRVPCSRAAESKMFN